MVELLNEIWEDDGIWWFEYYKICSNLKAYSIISSWFPIDEHLSIVIYYQAIRFKKKIFHNILLIPKWKMTVIPIELVVVAAFNVV